MRESIEPLNTLEFTQLQRRVLCKIGKALVQKSILKCPQITRNLCREELPSLGIGIIVLTVRLRVLRKRLSGSGIFSPAATGITHVGPPLISTPKADQRTAFRNRSCLSNILPTSITSCVRKYPTISLSTQLVLTSQLQLLSALTKGVKRGAFHIILSFEM